jgi:hypothetical protein
MIEGSVATEMFRHGYAKVNGKKKDVMINMYAKGFETKM